jgi:hypothetical protein
MEQTVGLLVAGFLVSSIEFSDRVTSQSVSGRMSVRVLEKKGKKERMKEKVSQ